MTEHSERSPQYREILKQAIVEHRDAVYEAIVLHDATCLAGSFGRFLVEEAGWEVGAFTRWYERRYINA